MASANLSQTTTECQSVSASPPLRTRSVARRSWVTAMPDAVYFISGSLPTRPRSSTLLMVFAMIVPPLSCELEFP